MQITKARLTRLLSLGAVTALTLGIHYGWVLEPIFGDAHWTHALHGRFCYIPIVIAASWFGVRGGLATAAVISILVLPFIVVRDLSSHNFVTEIVEIVFYFAIALLTGALVDREFFARRKQEQAQLQAERSQKLSLVGQIAAGVAHEIKNPLASIKGAADILTDETTSPPEREEFRGILHNEVKRIDGTVTEFLEFARPKETRLDPLDFSETVQSCVRQIDAQARAERISITSDIASGIRISGDGEKLQQMILNLLLNALQASPPDSTIRVALSYVSESTAQLLIQDAGSGIDQRNLHRIFEPFYTTKASGTGLGLAIVKSILDSHDGGIRIVNNDAAGVSVLVDLPTIPE